MNRKIMIGVFWSVAAVAGCAALFFVTKSSGKKNMKLPAPVPDVVATSTAPDDSVLIKNETAGYAVSVPRHWYLEKGAGSGVTVYPDYDAVGKILPGCKIEISTLSNPDRGDLADWLTAYLHEDPTADVLEISRVTTTIAHVPAILWSGALNGVSSALAYVATGTKVYEIAPSVITKGEGGPLNADCKDAFRSILENFRFAP